MTKLLNSYNAFGTAAIRKDYVGVLVFAFAGGKMYKTARRNQVLPPLRLEKGLDVAFGIVLDPDSVPDITFSFVKEPASPDAVVLQSNLVEFIRDAALDLAKQIWPDYRPVEENVAL